MNTTMILSSLSGLISTLGGFNEEDFRLPRGVDIPDAHRHSRDGRPLAPDAGHFRYGRAIDLRSTGTSITASGKHNLLRGIPSALLRAGHRASLYCYGINHRQDDYVSRLLGHAGSHYGFRAHQHDRHYNLAEVRHQGPHARPSSGSGRIGLVSTRSESLYQRASAPRAGRAFSIKKKVWYGVTKSQERSAL